MPRRHSVVISIVCGASLWLVGQVFAQVPSPVRVVARNATAVGRVHGLVRDGAGRGVADASVLAVGQTVISARSDLNGRFQLSLPPGDYVLRASRDGYLSTYREPVRVVSTTLLERNITLTKQNVASVTPASSDDHAHSDAAWRLRQLTRSVLRDGSAVVPGEPEREAPTERRADTSSRLAVALAQTDFRGQVNFVTTAVAAPLSAWGPASWPRGVAFVTLGAPVAGHGAWQMRAAVAAGDGSSWNLLGEYEADPAGAHAWKLGLSYSAQGYTRTTDRLSAAVAEIRTVAGVSAQDQWRLAPGFELDYGVRAERFDYLIEPNLFSANGGLVMRLLPRTHVRASAARQMVAPGADEFLPPHTATPWLPAERTFFPLAGRGTLRAEEVLHGEIAVVHELGSRDASPTIHVRRFRQRTRDQMATLFGVDGDAGRGQYFVANVGGVDLVGWGVGASGRFSRYFRGEIEYARVSADWLPGTRLHGVHLAAPSVVRPDLEHVHDVTATLEADLAMTATHVSLVYRGSSAFSRQTADSTTLPGSRFDVQVRQALPYQPTRGGRLELLFSIRNLYRDARGDASWYDELLTVGPPLRLMGGVQVRF